MKSLKLTAIATVAISVAASGAPGDTELVSERFDAPVLNVGGNSSSITNRPQLVSDDGRYVAFYSHASNLVPGDANGRADVFVYDRVNDSVERVSVDSSGDEANSESYSPSISDDGNLVAFRSRATNLAPGDTNSRDDIFVHDRLNGTTELISVDSDEVLSNNYSYEPSISGDGNYVAFYSYATNLVTDDTNGRHDIFVRDRVNGTTERVSVVDGTGAQANFDSYEPSISDDGNLVAFRSRATNLHPDDTNTRFDIYVRDRLNGTTELISVDSNEILGNHNSYEPAISGNGNYVAFYSYASNLVTGDTNGRWDVFVRDRVNGTTERVSIVDGTGAQANLDSYFPSISDDGNLVAFRSRATNLVAGDTNGRDDIFVHNRTTGETVIASVDSAGTLSDGYSYEPSISGDGSHVAFHSSATNLVIGDENQVNDVFLLNLVTGSQSLASRSEVPLSLYGGDNFSDIYNSGLGAVSQTGRYVAFYSNASNLVTGDTNGRRDIFVRDRSLDTTERVSVAHLTGVEANQDSFDPSISDDGNLVAFRSRGTNLAPGDTNNRYDIFVRDRANGTTELISVDSNEALSDNDSLYVSISGAGGHVAFASRASNLVAGDTNNRYDIFVRDRVNGTTERVSVADGTGAQANIDSFFPSVSDDGNLVAFRSQATNLHPNDTNTRVDVYVRDRVNGTTELISVDSNEVLGNSHSWEPSISGDGNYVAFYSHASNLVTGDTNGRADIFVRDRVNGTTERVSVADGTGAQANFDSYLPSISDDGNLVAFYSRATNLVVGDTNNRDDIFVHNRTTGETVLASVDNAGILSDGYSYYANISGDGSAVAFRSSGTNLAPDGNRHDDVFIHELGGASNTAPEADDDNYNATEDTVLNVNAPGVLDGDTDADGDTLTAALDTDVSNGSLTLNADGSFDYTPDGDFCGADSFTYLANDSSEDSNIATVSLNVACVNDAPSFTANDPPATNEDSGPQSESVASGFDPGPANEATQVIASYDVSNVTNATLLSAGPSVDASGILTYTPASDANGTVTFDLRVKDDGGTANGGDDTSTPAQTVTITIDAVNDAPTFTANDPPAVNEDSGPHSESVATGFDPGPADESGQAVDSYIVTNISNAALLAAGPSVAASGFLSYTPAPDANGTVTFDLQVKDNGGTLNSGLDTSTPAQQVTITINAVNEAPNFTVVDPPAINEDSGPQNAAIASGFDPGPANESGQTIDSFIVTNVSNPTYLSAGPSVDNTGSLSYTPAADAFGTVTFDLQVQDDGGTANGGDDTSATQSVSITINPVNDAPSFNKTDPPAVNEDSGVQNVVIASAFGSGPANESGQAIDSYIVSSVSNGALLAAGPTVDTAGSLTYTPAADASGTVTFNLQAKDDGGVANGGADRSSPAETVTITINAVNDAPSFTANNPPAVNEDAGIQNVVVATGFDPGAVDEAGQAIDSYIVSNIGNGSLLAGPPTVNASGTLTYTPAADAFGTVTFDLQVKDNGGIANGGVDTSSPAQSVTITINSVNDAPSYNANHPPAVAEDAGPQLATVATAFNPGPANEASQSISTYVVSSVSNPGLLSAGPTVDTNGQLSYTPAPDANGVVTFALQVRDDGGVANGGVDTSPQNQFLQITINAVNDAPSFTANNPPAVNEDAGSQNASVASGFNPGAADEAGQIVNAYLVSNVSNAGLLAAGPVVDTSGNLSYTPAADANGVVTFDLQVQDNGGTANGGVDISSAQSVTITINAINDAPSFTANNPPAVNEDSGVQNAPVSSGFSAGPGNESGQAVSSYLVSNIINGSLLTGAPSVDATGVVTYTPALDANGTVTFDLQVKDDGGTADGGIDTSSPPQTVTITINAVNDAPSFTANNPPAVNEDAGAQMASVASAFDPGPADESGQTVAAYLVSNVLNGGLLAVGPTVDSSGNLSYTPALNANGTVTFDLRVQDNGGTANGGDDTSATQSITITINAVNDVPVIANPIDDVEVNEDAGDEVLDLSTVFADVDIFTNGDSLTLTVSGNDNTSLVSTALLGTTLTLDFLDDQNGTAMISIRATDTGGLYVTDVFEVTVNPVNDGPSASASADAQTLQYSDPIAAVTISGDDIDSTNLTLTSTSWTKNGGGSQAGLPAGLSVGSSNCGGGAPPAQCTWSVSGNIQEGPGDYVVAATIQDNGELGDTTQLSATTTFSIEVIQEDAVATYTGPTTVWTPSVDDRTVTITLMATIQDITAVGGDPDPGDIRNANVGFYDGTSLLCQAPSVTLIFAGDETVGSASCEYTVTLANNEDARLIDVTTVVDNYYVGDDNEVVVTVAKPGDGFITGGGYLIESDSAGTYAAGAGTKANYGFKASATKKGKKTQLKGRATIIVRDGNGNKYKIKSNALLSLGVDLDPDGDDNSDDPPHEAQFESKANLTDVTDPLNPISLGGNLLLQLRMTDNGEPGENDTISFTLWDGGQLLFSSSWNGAESVEQPVSGGNLQVH